MLRETSLTRRLALFLTGGLLVFWFVAIGISILVISHELDEIFDSSLQKTTERLLALVNDEMQVQGGSLPQRTVASASPGAEEYLTYQVRKPDGTVILRSQDAPATAFDAPLETGFHDTGTQRIYTATDPNKAVFLQVADRFSNRREAVSESATAMLLPLIFLIPASFVAIWILAGRALKPINVLRDAIATKDSGNLAPLENHGIARELKPIVRSVNMLLDRLKAAFEAERAFTANSAHELRTPIAGALAHTQMLARELPDGPLKARARTVEGALSDMGRLSEKLLQLSRADSGIGTKKTATDITEILEVVVDDFARNPMISNYIRYDDTSTEPVIRSVDIDALGIAIRNIMENALVHRDEGTFIDVSIDPSGMISVVNESPVIPRSDLERLKKRFHRGATKASGSGLGLAISDKLVTQMGGRLELYSPPPGRTSGFEARIILPASTQNDPPHSP